MEVKGTRRKKKLDPLKRWPWREGDKEKEYRKIYSALGNSSSGLLTGFCSMLCLSREHRPVHVAVHPATSISKWPVPLASIHAHAASLPPFLTWLHTVNVFSDLRKNSTSSVVFCGISGLLVLLNQPVHSFFYRLLIWTFLKLLHPSASLLPLFWVPVNWSWNNKMALRNQMPCDIVSVPCCSGDSSSAARS